MLGSLQVLRQHVFYNFGHPPLRMNILHYSQIKYLGKVSIFWCFWGELLLFFANSNEKYELSCRLYGLRVTFGEEFVSILWEMFP